MNLNENNQNIHELIFPQPGLPWGSYSPEEISVRVARASGSPTLGAPVPPAPGPQVPQA